MQPFSSFADLLYPPACLLCRSASVASQGANPLICDECLAAMPRCGPPVCSSCGVGLPGAFDAVASCAACRKRPRAFDAARAPWRYQGTAQEAVRQFKYHHRWRIGRWLARDMAQTARESLPVQEISLVLPVPLHGLKRWLRGWNPSESLARQIAAELGVPCRTRGLRRTRWTRSQTRLSWRRRAQNVRQAFEACSSSIQDQTILLVDDVLTSGATADSCAAALKQAGARRVFVLAAARTPLD